MSKSEGGAIGGLNADNIPWADDDVQGDGANSATMIGSSGETVSSEESRRRRSLMARRSHANHLYIKIPQDDQSPDTPSTTGNITSDDDENPGPLKEKESGDKRGLRRNSISLPTLNAADLEALVAVHDAAQEVREKQTRKAGDDGESMVCSIEPDTEHSSEDEDKKPAKK